ncbi:aerolysin-like protein [Gadus morhua]|uniref:aerolysin-like protein n=1 Tax=Gadus morhua TaxID=8049 RepID=UPI0011B7AC88|nr:aerolysin-like protein [Gadus morhua]
MGNSDSRPDIQHDGATTVSWIGGYGGDTFDFTGRNDGATLKKIGVSVGGEQIKAVRAELTNGRVETFGRANTSYQEFLFGPEERIISLTLWDNGQASRLGGIKFCTSLGVEFFSYMNRRSLKNGYSIDVGSGVCLGLQGKACKEIDCMGFLFIKAIDSAVLTKINFPSLRMSKPQVNNDFKKSKTYENNTAVDQEYKFAYSRPVKKSITWSNTTKIESNLMSVVAGIPDLMEVAGGFTLNMESEKSCSMTDQENIEESNVINVMVPAGKTMRVDVSGGRAVINLAYTAIVSITCQNGSELSFNTSGIYNRVAYTKVKEEISQIMS